MTQEEIHFNCVDDGIWFGLAGEAFGDWFSLFLECVVSRA
jgi:hypothetical protein